MISTPQRQERGAHRRAIFEGLQERVTAGASVVLFQLLALAPERLTLQALLVALPFQDTSDGVKERAFQVCPLSASHLRQRPFISGPNLNLC